jgi:hypothetical protein
MTDTINLFAKPAGALAANAVAFIAASGAADTASTPYARSALATVIGGLASFAMVESVLIAAMGSPKSPATGKPIAKASGLRDFPGGARVYQAHKAIAFVLDNIDADAILDASNPEAVVPGAAAIRPLVEGFILETGDVKALFGKSGLEGKVKAAMADHAKAVATLHGVVETPAETETNANDNAAPQTLAERAAVLLVALRAASDAEFTDAQTALAMVSDYIDTRWNDIADATAPATSDGTVAEAIAA